MKPSIVRSASYGSATVFSFDRALALERLAQAARALKRDRPDVTAVHVFGSVARGTAVPGSDADVAVVLAPDSPLLGKRPMDRVLALMPWFADVGIGVDIVAFAPERLRAIRSARAWRPRAAAWLDPASSKH